MAGGWEEDMVKRKTSKSEVLTGKIIQKGHKNPQNMQRLIND